MYFLHIDRMYQLAKLDKFPFRRDILYEKRNQINIFPHVRFTEQQQFG